MIPYGRHHIDEEDIQAVVDLLRNGSLTQGPSIEKFEQAVCEYVGVKYAVAVSSGTAALHLAVLAAEINEDSYLITSPITFVASANSAIYAGGKPLFADISPETINISTECVQEMLDNHPETRVIMPVHFAGLACEMSDLKKISDRHGTVIIEDGAHALGAKYPDGNYIGSCHNSLMTIFSFHPVKSIAAGEGGMITTNDEAIYRRLLRMRSHGINKLNDTFILPEQSNENGRTSPWYYEMQELGFNYRITDIQCGLALSQLKKLDKFIARRRELANKYDLAFQDHEFIKPAQKLGRDISSHHIYVVRINFRKASISRTDFMLKLREKNILTQVHYIPVPMHPYYRTLGFMPENYPHAMDYYQEGLSIPLYYDLTNEQQDYVINQIKALLI